MTPLEAYSVLIISGILIRYALIYAGQAWAKTYSQTISFLLLSLSTNWKLLSCKT